MSIIERDHSALYLDKIGGLTEKAFCEPLVPVEEVLTSGLRAQAAGDCRASANKFSQSGQEMHLRPGLAWVKPANFQ